VNAKKRKLVKEERRGETRRRLAETKRGEKMKRKTRKRKIARSQRGRSTRGRIRKERVGKKSERRVSVKKGERERRENRKSPGMPFRISRQVAITSKRRSQPFESASQPASRSQTKSHGFTYYDLHPCPLPLLLFLLSPLATAPSVAAAVTAAALLSRSC